MDYKCRTDSPTFHIDPAHDIEGKEPELPTSLDLVLELDDEAKSEFLNDYMTEYERARMFDAYYYGNYDDHLPIGDKLIKRFNDSRKGEYDNG